MEGGGGREVSGDGNEFFQLIKKRKECAMSKKKYLSPPQHKPHFVLIYSRD